MEAVKNYFKEFGAAVAKGNTGVKLSLVFMGMGYFFNQQFARGILVFLVEAAFIIYLIFSGIPSLTKFGTLGTVQREQVFDPITMQSTVNDYDNSFLILLSSILALFLIFVFLLFWISNVKSLYRLQKEKEAGHKLNSFKADLHELIGGKFHLTLLSLPVLGVVLMNILPILILIAIAFTNYDQNHLPPNALFTWVGIANFAKLFSGSITSSFGYAFRKVLGWTFVWALLATFTTFIGGILLAQLINAKVVKFKKFWRTLFIITIAVPQFVTLLLVRKFFADAGIVPIWASRHSFRVWDWLARI